MRWLCLVVVVLAATPAMATNRFFQQYESGVEASLGYQATVSIIQDQDHDNVVGDIGFDVHMKQRMRLTFEWKLNEDLRHHPITIRIGYVQPIWRFRTEGDS